MQSLTFITFTVSDIIEQGKMEKTGCKIICGAPTTLAVKGLMMSVSSFLMMVRVVNLPPIIAWKVSNTLGSFSFLRSDLSLVCFGLLVFFLAGL